MAGKMDRRRFLSVSAAFGAGLMGALKSKPAWSKPKLTGRDLVISTWKHGVAANEAAAKTLAAGKMKARHRAEPFSPLYPELNSPPAYWAF